VIPGLRVEQHLKHLHRLRDVPDLLLTQIVEAKIDLIRCQPMWFGRVMLVRLFGGAVIRGMLV
jgi:hypothetical protein